jgi:Tfp pilus assembly protein PilF
VKWARAGRAVAVVLALSAAGSGCGDDKSDEDKAAEDLEAALADHAEGRVDEATDGYRDVLERDPDNQFAHYNLGLIAQQEGRNGDAEQEYRAAIRTDPNFASALFNLAILRTEADPDEAEELYRQVLVLQPENASAHLNLGFLLIDQGEQDEGQAELDQAVELDPSLGSRLPEEEPEEELGTAADETVPTVP